MPGSRAPIHEADERPKKGGGNSELPNRGSAIRGPKSLRVRRRNPHCATGLAPQPPSLLASRLGSRVQLRERSDLNVFQWGRKVKPVLWLVVAGLDGGASRPMIF